MHNKMRLYSTKCSTGDNFQEAKVLPNFAFSSLHTKDPWGCNHKENSLEGATLDFGDFFNGAKTDS